ncbi:MAG: tetratricopeptide repeat protein, partial [Ferrovibrio sp.]
MRIVAAGLLGALFCAVLPSPAVLAQTAAPAALAAPPRSIADIVAILDQEKPDPAKRAQFIAQAEAPEPTGLNPRERSRFLFDRAQAAAQIGRPEAAQTDAMLAMQLAEQVGADTYRIAQLVAVTLRVSGDLQGAFDIYAKYADQMNKSNLRGRAVNAYRSAAMMALEMGRLEVAEKYVGYAQSVYTELATNTRNQSVFMVLTSWQSDIDLGKAQIALTRGRFAEAEKFFASSLTNGRDAIEKAKHWQNPPPAGGMENINDATLIKLGETKLAQGRIVEAEVDIRQGLLNILRRGGKYFPPTVQAVASLSAVMVEQGRYAEAEKLSRTAIEIVHGIGVDETAPQIINAKRALANILILQRRWQEAAALFEETLATVADKQDIARAGNRVATGRILALAYTGQGARSVDVASRILDATIARLGDKHFDTALARGMYGIALGAAGKDAEAVAAFRAAIPIIQSSSRQADTEESTSASRDFYIQTIVENYIVLLARAQGTPAASGLDAGLESFRLADVARGRSVQRALSASAARAAVKDPALATLIRDEQDVLKQIAAQFGLLSNLLTLPPGQRDDKAIKALRTEVDKLRDARAKTRQQIEKQFPEYASLIDPRPPSPDEMRAALRPGEALLSFYLAQDNSFIWVVPKDGPVRFAASPVGAAAIEQRVNKLRRALEPQAETLGEIPAFDLALAYELYQTLLQPVEAGWKPAKSLFVVSNGA